MVRADLIEPIERLGQFIYELQVLEEIEEKILGASISEYSPIEQIQESTIKAINHLSGIITTLSGEILECLLEET